LILQPGGAFAMKFLIVERIAKLNSRLSSRVVGDIVVDGKCEAYSCKMTSQDKRFAKALEKQYAEDVDLATSASPLGPLDDPSTRRLLANLILTMNASFPDYDFSSIKPAQFTHHPLSTVVSRVNANLQRLTEAGDKMLLKELWATLSEAIQLKDCEVYSYVPEEDGPFSEESTLWTLNYFFFNKVLKRILFFICHARSKHLTVLMDAQQYAADDGGAGVQDDTQDDAAQDDDDEEVENSVDIFANHDWSAADDD
jgi:hypothetical protein